MDGMMMVILLIVLCFSMADGQGNSEFKYLESCYLFGSTLTLEAVYTGSGTPSLVQWSYSGGTGTNLMIIEAACTVLGSVPAGYPLLSRMEFECPTTDALPANTYRLTVKNLTSDELTDSWGATFTPPMGTVPAADQIPITECQATTGDDSLSAGKIAGIVTGSVGGAGLLVGGAIFAYFKCKGDKEDTSRDVESTRSSPEKAENKLLNKEKQSSATGKADGGNKGKHVSDTQIHLDKSQKVHPENEEKLFRPQPLPPPGAKLNHSLAEDNHGTGADDSFSLTKLPPIQKTPRTDKQN